MPLKSRALLIFFCLLIYGCAAPQANVPENAAADKELQETGSVLHAYTALDANEAKLYIEEFEKETRVHVKWVRLSSGEVLTRLRNEKNNPQVSVWFGGPFTDFIAAKKEGLLLPYEPKINFKLPEGGYDHEHYWTGISFGAIGFVSNKEILQRKKLVPPESWDDLLKPAFHNDISMAYAYTSGTAYTILAALAQMKGEEAALKYFRALNKNIHHYNKSGSACVAQVSLGEIAVGIAFSQDILKKGIGKGFPVTMTFPKEGTGYEYAAMALLKSAPEVQLGKKFMDWMLGEKAQKIMVDSYRFPLNKNAAKNMKLKTSAYKLISFDAEKAGNEKKTLIEKWREVTAQ